MKKETGRSTKETFKTPIRNYQIRWERNQSVRANWMCRTLFGKYIFNKIGYNIKREWTQRGGETRDARGNDGRTTSP